MVRETGVQSQVKSYQRLKKMVLDATLLNPQHYKVQSKSKVEQSRELSSTIPLPRCSSYSKGAFANFTSKYVQIFLKLLLLS